VGPRRDLLTAGIAPEDLGDCALLPGLVNCHTHLELGGVGRVSERGFARWLAAVRAGRAAAGPDGQARAAAEGARRLLAAGVTAVGEVSTSGQSLAPLVASGLRGVVFHELLGVDPARAGALLRAARAELAALRRASGPRLRAGLAPHSPYALSEELLAAAARLAAGRRLALCIHLAESREETTYLAGDGGDIPAVLYPAVGAAPPPRRRARSPLAYLEAVGALVEGMLLVHAVHCDEEDIRRMRRRRLSVAHCPRSNAALSGGRAPVPALLRARVPVGLGTDSLASVDSLDPWEEMRAARAAQGGALGAPAVLRMATLGGAACLGLAHLTGSLEPGKQADLVAVAAPGVAATAPEETLLASAGPEDVRLVLIGGRPGAGRPEAMPACA